MSLALELANIRAGYGSRTVLHDISLTVATGELVAVIGANGAGKSTVLGSISGLVPIRAGILSLNGREITTAEAHARVPLGLAHVPEGRRIFPKLSVEENLSMGAFTVRDGAAISRQRAMMLDLFPVLAERRNQKGGTLSGGEQQMLAIARALMSKPSVLLLDEPSMGVAPLFVEKIVAALVALRTQGVTILLVEQNASTALSIADRAYVLEQGRIVLEGRGADLLKLPEVQEAYLGE
jgi:branched-chain amino acid transport system ATP-binding protein